MSHKCCDILGAVAVSAFFVGLLVTSADNQNFVLYAGLAALGAYAYVSIEVLPKRRHKASAVAVAYREVLPPPVPVESRNNGHTVTSERVRPARLPIAV